MLHIKSLDDGLKIFKALGSELRIQIVKLLLENRAMSMNELAGSLGITNGALTSHIKKLEESGIISVTSEYSGHGNQKICSVNVDKILVDIEAEEQSEGQNIYDVDIPVGHYTDYEVYPTCGIADADAVIGTVDDPRYFAHPARMNAGILWFTKGYVEYLIPNLLPVSQKVDEITISMELGSEAPGVNNEWPSDILFLLNDVELGTWTSPGDFGDVRGIFTPDWWLPNWNQYGLLKMIAVNRRGTFIDGLKISDVNIHQFDLNCRSAIRLKLMVREEEKHAGGLTIFGSGFGNYNQDIQVRIKYSPMQVPAHSGEAGGQISCNESCDLKE